MESNQVFFYTRGLACAPKDWRFERLPRVNRLYVIRGGTGWYLHNGQKIPLQKGCLYFFPYRFDFRVLHDPRDPIRHMYFDFSTFPPVRSREVRRVELAGEPALAHMAEALEVLLQQNPPRDAVITHLFLALFGAVCPDVDTPADDRLTYLVSYILQNITAPLSTGQLAEKVHLNPNYLIRIFKRYTGLTPHAYVLEHRLNLAVGAILDGATAEAAALSAGFESGSSLSHALKKYRGETVSQVRLERAPAGAGKTKNRT